MTTRTQITNFYFIECLDSKELNATNAFSLYDDIVRKMKLIDNNIDTEYFEIKTKEEFLNRFDWIYSKEIEKGNVLIHIYLHGSKHHDGLLANDQTLITWEEILEKSRSINIKSKNGLFLILALCHGKYIGEHIKIKLKSPFNSLIASNYEELVEDIYSLFEKFYNNLVYDNNIVRAFIEAQTDEDNYYFKNTNKIIEESYKSLLEKREQILPQLYKEFIASENAPKISFEEFDKINMKTFVDILDNMEKDFFI